MKQGFKDPAFFFTFVVYSSLELIRVFWELNIFLFYALSVLNLK